MTPKYANSHMTISYTICDIRFIGIHKLHLFQKCSTVIRRITSMFIFIKAFRYYRDSTKETLLISNMYLITAISRRNNTITATTRKYSMPILLNVGELKNVLHSNPIADFQISLPINCPKMFKSFINFIRKLSSKGVIEHILPNCSWPTI